MSNPPLLTQPLFKKYFPEIDSLRAIAAMMVVLGHSGTFLFIRGWQEKSVFSTTNFGFGVDLFFVISGFVVFSSILPHMHILKQDFFSFWFKFLTRRFFRLAPICFFWLFIVLFLSREFPSYFLDYKTTLHEAIGIVSYLYNYMAAFGFYLIKDAPLSLGYHHSLNTEEQFYFFLPVLFFLFSEKWITMFSIAVIFLGFIIQRPTAWYYFRYDSFFYGILLSLIFHRLPLHSFKIPGFIKIFLLKMGGPVLMWIGIWFLIHVHYHPIHQRTFETAALVSVFMLILACLGVKPLIVTKLDLCLGYIGKRSYTLYLTHMPTFMILNALLIKFNWTNDGVKMQRSFNQIESTLIVLSGITILWLFVELSYRYIELPSRNMGKKLSAKPISYLDLKNKIIESYEISLVSRMFLFKRFFMPSQTG